MEKETRTLIEPVEIRTAEDGTTKIVGYAAKFNTRSQDLGGFTETIDPNFFNGCLTGDTRALVNHDPNQVLGRTTAGTMRLSVDAVGLRYEIDPPDTQCARDLQTSMKRGDINQSSFAFNVDNSEDKGDSFEFDSDKNIYVRTLLKCKRLYDVSPVTYPAYDDTESNVSQRSLDGVKKLKEAKLKSLEKNSIDIKRKRLDMAEKYL
jgi:HK97 family phage prohead protease